MAMVGHRTEAIYRRYAIVDEAMLREGGAKLAAYSEGTVGKVQEGLDPGTRDLLTTNPAVRNRAGRGTLKCA